MIVTFSTYDTINGHDLNYFADRSIATCGITANKSHVTLLIGHLELQTLHPQVHLHSMAKSGVVRDKELGTS